MLTQGAGSRPGQAKGFTLEVVKPYKIPRKTKSACVPGTETNNWHGGDKQSGSGWVHHRSTKHVDPSESWAESERWTSRRSRYLRAQLGRVR